MVLNTVQSSELPTIDMSGIHTHLEAHKWTSKLRLGTQTTVWFTLQRHTELSAAAQTHRDIYCYLFAQSNLIYLKDKGSGTLRLLKLLLKLQLFTLKPQQKSEPPPCTYFKMTSRRLVKKFLHCQSHLSLASRVEEKGGKKEE